MTAAAYWIRFRRVVKCASVRRRVQTLGKTTQKQAELAVCKALAIQHRSRRCCPRLVARTQGSQQPRVVGCGGSKPAFRLRGILSWPAAKGASGPCTVRRSARDAPPGPSARPRGEPSTRKGCPLGIGLPGLNQRDACAPPRRCRVHTGERSAASPIKAVKHGRRRPPRAEGGLRPRFARGRRRRLQSFCAREVRRRSGADARRQ